MARGTGTVTVKFLGDISDLKKATEDADGALGKIGSSIGGIAKTAAAVGIPALVGFGGAALTAFADAEKVGAQTEAVLKSTGSAAHVTAGQVGELAGNLSKMSGVDDEAIQSGENLLLTFTNVKNGVGKGNDIFDQATATMLDMSVAMGTDASSQAIQLGKALNDPIAGIGALSRVGVTFTDKQKDQIKALVASGKTMEAQKIILKELQTEFGGSAKAAGETFAGSMNKLKVQAGNFMEDVGSKLAPFVLGFSNALGEDGIGGAFNYAVEQFKKAWPSIQAALEDLVHKIAGWITGTAAPFLQEQFPVWIEAFWKWIQEVTPPALKALAAFIGDVGAWILNPGLPTLADALLNLTKAAWHWIQDATPLALGQLVDWMAQLGSWILNTGVPKLVGFLADLGVKLIDWISDVFPQIPGKMGELVGKIGAWIVTTGIPQLAVWTAKITELFGSMILDAAKDAPEKLGQLIGAIAGWIKDKAPGLMEDAKQVLVGIITAPFKIAFNTIAGFWNNTVGKIHFDVPDWVPGLGGKGFNFPTIQPLAAGGIVKSPTMALIGEAGPEAVIPLNRSAEGLGGNSVTVNFYGPQDRAGVAREIESILTDFVRQGGNLRFT